MLNMKSFRAYIKHVSRIAWLGVLLVNQAYAEHRSAIEPTDVAVLSQLVRIRNADSPEDVKAIFRASSDGKSKDTPLPSDVSIPDQQILGVPFAGSAKFSSERKMESLTLSAYRGPSRQDQLDNSVARELYQTISEYLLRTLGKADEVTLENVDDSRAVFRLVRSWSDADHVFGVEFYSNGRFGSVYLYVQTRTSWEHEYGSGEYGDKQLSELQNKSGRLPKNPAW